jgi:hypothetical protein
MKKSMVILACAFTFFLAQDAFAAVKFQRVQHCPDGLVSAKTCECRASNSRRWHYCHAGQYCHLSDGSCTN